MKINKKFIMTKKAGMSYSEIFLLVMFSVAISYLISCQTTGVDAQVTPKYCCPKTKAGAICQEISDVNECQVNPSPTSCSESSSCRPGCCISSQTGICDAGTPKVNCTTGNFMDNCNTVTCKKGCCTLGNGAIWTTENNCKFESSLRGFSFNFTTGIKSEPLCIFGVEKDRLGACILESNSTRTCKYLTLSECNLRTKFKGSINNPSFYSGVLCSDPSLNTSCKAKDSKACVEGKEDVYWFDSCGNQEDAAVKCEFLKKGKYCKESAGTAVCKDVNCVVDGVTRKNGESWCEYDGTIGDGKDPVGSRHVKHVCFMGEEKIEPCSDYRNEICVQSDTQTTDGQGFSQAACKVNNWRACYNYNQLEDAELVKKCNTETDCFVNDINIDEHFKFKVCVPKYPPGFSFETPTAEQIQNEEKTKTESNCAIATQTCTETWKWCLLTGWKCIDNCNCHEPVFTTKMNEFCASLGDCGAWTNYNGDFTDAGYSLTAEKAWPPKLDQAEISKIKSYARPNPSQKPAEPGDFTLETQSPESLETISGYDGVLSGASGVLGSALLAKVLSSPENISTIAAQTVPTSINYAQFASGAFASVARGIQQSNEEVPNAMIWAAVGGAIGFALGYLINGAMLGMIMGIVFALIIFLFMFCKIKKFNVTFTCNKWERPTGGDCNACNQKLDVPCTKYRCESLGQTCRLVNEGTTAQMCLDKCKDTQSIPEIKPWNGINNSLPSTGYIYRTIDGGYEVVKPNGDCIDPYTTVGFGISLVEDNDPNAECKFAQCKITPDASKPFEEIDAFFGDRSFFLPYHKSSFFFPSPEALRHQYNLSDAKIRELSTMEFYVRCKSATGQMNPQPYKIKTCVSLGPDLIAPVIRGTFPEKGSYIPYGQETVNLQLYVNEPSNCRYSNMSKGYDQMENEMTCDTDLLNYTSYGWTCNTNLTKLNETTFIKCRDISENNNTMSESYEYNLALSSTPLQIKSMLPLNNQEISSGVEPVEVNLRLETIGGAQGGKATCSWSGNGFEDQFTETNSNFHSYLWRYGMEGSYDIAFKCEDVAGNVAENSSSFRIFIDDLGPIPTRVYGGGGLVIHTNENAECRYSFNKTFAFENATLMSGDELEHFCEWRPLMYYIQCMDKYKTKGGIIQIKGYNIFQ